MKHKITITIDLYVDPDEYDNTQTEAYMETSLRDLSDNRFWSMNNRLAQVSIDKTTVK